MQTGEKRLKIAVLTTLDPTDRRTWSGTNYYISQALQRQCGDVDYIGPIQSRERVLGKIIHKLSSFFLKKNFAYNASFLIAKKHSQVAARRLAGQAFDVIVAPSGAPEIAFLKTDIPIVLIEDATFVVLHNYYPQYSNLLKISIRQAHAIAQRAINNARIVLYSSEWAARSAIDYYHADSEKVHVIPFGANMETVPAKELVLARKKSADCRLLFMGVSWERKGGAIAFETLVELEKLGVKAELIVCGCTPPAGFSHERMKVIPFLDKNDERQREELNKLFVMADFLLLPTRNDCTPIVFCEANAFGLPVITTDTGGVSGVVQDGENGFMLSHDARGAEYAALIARVYNDDEHYARLVQSSRAAFDNRLNWDAWGTSVKKLLDKRLPTTR